MKRIFSTILILFTLLALSTGTVFAGSAMELLEVRNDGGGPTFVFRVIGEFSRSELESGFVHVSGGEDQALYCAQVDATTVVCHTPKKAGGKNVVVGFGNARFWVFVPEARPEKQYCYSVWDWWDFTGYHWTDFGPICQDEPAYFLDIASYDVPEQGIYGSPVLFFDYDVSGNCVPPVPYNGPAYYHALCP